MIKKDNEHASIFSTIYVEFFLLIVDYVQVDRIRKRKLKLLQY
jgi:hypothetical protein